MNMIERNVWVLEKEYVKPIEIVQSTDMVPIRVTLMDYLIPDGAAATVYALTRGHTEGKRALAVIGENNEVTFTPEAGFFTEGKVGLQIRITGANQRNLVSFAVPVVCYKDALDDAGEVENPTLLSQILAQLAKMQLNIREMSNQEMDIIFDGGTITGTEPGEGGEIIIQTNDYNNLANKPQINDITLIGNLQSEDLSLYGTNSAMSSDELNEMFAAVFV